MKPEEILRDPHDAVIGLDAGEAVRASAYGRRAMTLARLASLGLPVPEGAALSFECVDELAAGGALPKLPLATGPGDLFAVRSSPEVRAWGGPSAVLNLGVDDASLGPLAAAVGETAALRYYIRAVASVGPLVHGIDVEEFEARRCWRHSASNSSTSMPWTRGPTLATARM